MTTGETSSFRTDTERKSNSAQLMVRHSSVEGVYWSGEAEYILVVVGFLPFGQNLTTQPFFSVCSGHVATTSKILIIIMSSFMQGPSLQWLKYFCKQKYDYLSRTVYYIIIYVI